MLQNAPYLTRPIATVLPASSWLRLRSMQLGLSLYDLIAWKGGLPKRCIFGFWVMSSHPMKWKEVQYLFPNLDFDWIKGGLVYMI